MALLLQCLRDVRTMWGDVDPLPQSAVRALDEPRDSMTTMHRLIRERAVTSDSPQIAVALGIPIVFQDGLAMWPADEC